MSRDYLNKGHRIQDSIVLSGAVPEVDPSLVVDGVELPVDVGGVLISPPYLLVVIDIDGGAAPTTDIEFWGYYTPPAAAPALLSDWQHLCTVTMADSVGTEPTMAVFPLVGLNRYAIPVKGVTGAPTGIRVREIAISEAAADALVGSGLAASGGTVSGVTAGDVPDDDPASASNPVKVGGVVAQVPGIIADGDMAHLTTDRERALRTVDKAYNVLLGAQSTLVVNPDSANHDAAAQVLCDETNIVGPTTVSYPSAAGIEIGDRTFLSCMLSLLDVTSVAFEVSNDGALWDDATGSVTSNGSSGHVATYFAAGAGATVIFSADWERCGFRYMRCSVTVPNNTNVVYIDLIQRAL